MFNNLDTMKNLSAGYKRLSDDAQERLSAAQMFERRFSEGRRRRLAASLMRRATRMLSLANITLCMNAIPHYVGMQIVPLDQIVGTENRSDEFDADFYPTKDYVESRWISVAIAYLRGIALPAVELIQVGDAYYVRDGHHRISVARAFGNKVIDAEVTVLS